MLQYIEYVGKFIVFFAVGVLIASIAGAIILGAAISLDQAVRKRRNRKKGNLHIKVDTSKWPDKRR